MSTVVKSGGVVDRLICVLSYSKWQTGSLVACQITFPPDALARMAASAAKHRRVVDPSTDCVTKALSHMHRVGKVERRIATNGAFEYRLIKGCEEKCKSYPQRIKHDAYHKGYVRKSEYLHKKRFSEVTKELVFRGVLIEEENGDFTLNPNIGKECKINECT
jgi:hypothetical protein